MSFPHEQDNVKPNPILLSTGYKLFDEMLSYCSCLFLAQYIHYFYKTDDLKLDPHYWINQPQRVYNCAKEFHGWRKKKLSQVLLTEQKEETKELTEEKRHAIHDFWMSTT